MGRKKIGGGCISTIIVFIIIYYALGTCNSHPVVQTPPHKTSFIQSPVHNNANVYFLQEKQETEAKKSLVFFYTLK